MSSAASTQEPAILASDFIALLKRVRAAHDELEQANEVWFTDPKQARSRTQAALGLLIEGLEP